jgi:hypothetical protein
MTQTLRSFPARLLLAVVVTALIASFCYAALDRTVSGGAGALGQAEQAAVTGEGVQAAAAAPIGTPAERNRYIRCVAPGTEVTYTLRVRLLRYAGTALFYLGNGNSRATTWRKLVRIYGLTSWEAQRVTVCADIVWPGAINSSVAA